MGATPVCEPVALCRGTEREVKKSNSALGEMDQRVYWCLFGVYVLRGVPNLRFDTPYKLLKLLDLRS